MALSSKRTLFAALTAFVNLNVFAFLEPILAKRMQEFGVGPAGTGFVFLS
jgi:hypothetical protein